MVSKSIQFETGNKLTLKSDFSPLYKVTESGNLVPVTETLRTKDSNYEVYR